VGNNNNNRQPAFFWANKYKYRQFRNYPMQTQPYSVCFTAQRKSKSIGQFFIWLEFFSTYSLCAGFYCCHFKSNRYS